MRIYKYIVEYPCMCVRVYVCMPAHKQIVNKKLVSKIDLGEKSQQKML